MNPTELIENILGESQNLELVPKSQGEGDTTAWATVESEDGSKFFITVERVS